MVTMTITFILSMRKPRWLSRASDAESIQLARGKARHWLLALQKTPWSLRDVKGSQASVLESVVCVTKWEGGKYRHHIKWYVLIFQYILCKGLFFILRFFSAYFFFGVEHVTSFLKKMPFLLWNDRTGEAFLFVLVGRVKKTTCVDPFAQFLKIVLNFETQNSGITIWHCFASLKYTQMSKVPLFALSDTPCNLWASYGIMV